MEVFYIVCIVLLVVFAILSIWGPGGYMEMRRAHRELEIQRERTEKIRRNNEEKLREIEALRSDKEALERVARENGYGRPGEIVQQLPAESSTKTEPRKQ